MAGFFGLFGKKNKSAGKAERPSQSSNSQNDAYFLGTDDAKSLGDTEYMRTPIKVRRTFPKTLNSNGAEVVKEISATEVKKLRKNGQPVSTPSATPASGTGTSGTNAEIEAKKTERSTSDNSLDMFRQMAKQIKK